MVAIIDYGMGNLSSVQKAFNAIGAESIITCDKDIIEESSHLLLPGVGSYKKAMGNLIERNLVDIIKAEVNKKKPLLGICLGMQLLAESSIEDEPTPGFGFINGEVLAIPKTGLPNTHVGWNDISYNNSKLFDGIENPNFYFVHSYSVQNIPEDQISATVDYGVKLVAAVEKENVYGAQFHPEKSQKEGLRMLTNFMNLC